MNAGHGATGFNVCPDEFQSSLGHISPFYAPISPFRMGMFTLDHSMLEVYNLLLNFTGAHSQVSLEFKKRLWT
jgi:hypothetical protein